MATPRAQQPRKKKKPAKATKPKTAKPKARSRSKPKPPAAAAAFTAPADGAAPLYDLVCSREGTLKTGLELVRCMALAREHNRKDGHDADCILQ